MKFLGLIFLFVSLIASYSGRAQDSLAKGQLPLFAPIEWRLGAEGMSGASGEFSVNSSGFTGEFYRPFVRGGHIDEALKRRTMEGMEPIARFGGDRILSMEGSFMPDTVFGEKNRGQRFFVRLKDGRHYHARFTQDLFRTIFFGNSGMERAELAPFRMSSMRYRQFKLGVLDRKGSFEFGVAVGLLQGVSDLRVRVNEGSLRTLEKGEELRLRLQGDLRRQERNDPWSFSGTGGSIDVMAGYDFGDYGMLRLSVMDMGLLNWAPEARVHRVDTNIRFRGFQVRGIPSGAEGSAPLDSLQESYFPDADTGAYASFFPGTFRLAYSVRTPSGVWFRTSLTQRTFAAHVPFVNVEGMKDWGRFRGGASVGYGGYGEFAFGVMAGLRLGDHWDLYLRSRHLEGLIFSRRMGGIAGQVGIHYRY